MQMGQGASKIWLLGEAAGFEFVKLWDIGEMGLIEYRF